MSCSDKPTLAANLAQQLAGATPLALRPDPPPPTITIHVASGAVLNLTISAGGEPLPARS